MAVRPARDPGLTRRRLLLGAGLSIALHAAALGWVLRAPVAPAPAREAGGVELLSIELAGGPRSEQSDWVPDHPSSPRAVAPAGRRPGVLLTIRRLRRRERPRTRRPAAPSSPSRRNASNGDAAPSGPSAEVAPTARAESATVVPSVQADSFGRGEHLSPAPGSSSPGASSAGPGPLRFRRGWTFRSLGASGAPGSDGSSGATSVPPALHARLAEAAERCYPPPAKRLRLTGRSLVSFCVGTAGEVSSVSLERGSGQVLLDRAATECVVRSRGASSRPGRLLPRAGLVRRRSARLSERVRSRGLSARRRAGNRFGRFVASVGRAPGRSRLRLGPRLGCRPPRGRRPAGTRRAPLAPCRCSR